MIPKSYWIDEHVYSENNWVVDGLISPHINAISGQPKVGKSTLVTQIALAVVNQTPLLYNMDGNFNAMTPIFKDYAGDPAGFFSSEKVKLNY
jgi:AAA15 family ATPase/GTPase